MDLKNSLNVDGSITASGRLGGGEQAVSAGDAVLLGSDGKIPSEFLSGGVRIESYEQSPVITKVTINVSGTTGSRPQDPTMIERGVLSLTASESLCFDKATSEFVRVSSKGFNITSGDYIEGSSTLSAGLGTFFQGKYVYEIPDMGVPNSVNYGYFDVCLGDSGRGLRVWVGQMDGNRIITSTDASVLGSTGEDISLSGTFDLISGDLIVTDDPLTGSSIPSSYVKIIDL